MKKWFFIILSFLGISTMAQAVTKEEADSAYVEGNYKKAISLYNSLLSEGISY